MGKRGQPPKVERNAAMAADYRAGLTLRELGLRYGMSASCALRILRRTGVSLRPRGRPTKVADQTVLG